tara:strand:- start:603 stop:731 length:129 start_codon:yes stop_codon:yes gene_type:complete
MKVLVTLGSEFIGNYVLKELLKKEQTLLILPHIQKKNKEWVK